MTQDQDTRSRSGSTADRAPLKAIGGTAAASGVVGLLVATADWASNMVEAHHWLTPDNALMVLWATALAPMAHLAYQIVLNRLKKAAEREGIEE